MAEVDKVHVPEEDETNPQLGDDIPNHWLEKASTELKLGYREIETLRKGEIKKFRIAHPSVGQEMELNNVYTNKYNELFGKPGFMTRKELRKKLLERGTLDPDDEKRMDAVNASMKSTIEEINLLITENDVPPKKRIEKLKKKYYSLRTELFDLTHAQTEHFVNSIENIAEQLQTFHKLVMCVKDVEGKPIWDSVEQLYDETDRTFVGTLITEGSLYWNGLSREVLDDLPGVIESVHRGETSENLQEENGS